MKIRKFTHLPFPKSLLAVFGVGVDPRMRRARMRGSVAVPGKAETKEEGAGDPPPSGDKKPADAPPAGEEEPTDPPAPEAAAKPTVFDRAANFLKSKEAVATEIAGYKTEIARLKADLAARDATIATQNTELATLRAGAQLLESAVKGLESEKKTVAEATVDALAASGVPQDKLPAADKSGQPGEDAQTDEEKLKHYGTLKGAARTKYFRAHKPALVRAQDAAADKKS